MIFSVHCVQYPVEKNKFWDSKGTKTLFLVQKNGGKNT